MLANLGWLGLYDNQLNGEIPPELGKARQPVKGWASTSNQLT